jgi:DNA-binding XRE family transcriptional regulator
VTTKRDTPTIGDLLTDKRAKGPKAGAARAIGVSRQIYDAWEHGLYVPGDEWAESLAAYLDRDLRELVWLLYQERAERANGGEGPNAHNLRSVIRLRVVRPTDNRPSARQAA